MLKKILIFLLIFSGVSLFADTWTSTSSGTWNGTGSGTATWSCTGTCSTTRPSMDISAGSGHTVIINHPITSSNGVVFGGAAGTLTINSTLSATTLAVTGYAVMTLNGTGTLSLTDATSTSVNLNGGGSTVNIGVNLTSAGGMSISNGNVTTVNGATTLSGKLTISGGSGVTFNSSLSAGSFDLSNNQILTLNGNTTVTGEVKAIGSAKIKGTSTRFSYGTVVLSGGGAIIGNNNEASCSFTSTVPPSPLNLSSCTLPIVLKEFNVKQEKNGFDFSWSTLQEINNDFFTLEYSFDAKNFVEFAEIEGAGTSYQTLEYNYIESKLSFARDIEVVYFRLKQTDFDGTYAYSHIVPVRLDGNVEISRFHFYPNPANTSLTLRLEDWFDYKGDLELSLVNMSGVSYTKTVNIKSTETKIDIAELPTGIYMVITGGLVNPSKILIE